MQQEQNTSQDKRSSGGPRAAGALGQSSTQTAAGVNAFVLPTLPDYPPPSAAAAAYENAPATTVSSGARVPSGGPVSARVRTSGGAALSEQVKSPTSLNISQRISETSAQMPAVHASLDDEPITQDFAPRKPTLTSKMRALQPPDVARQAMSELSLLARELDALPKKLEEVGLAGINQRRYLDATDSYLELAHQAWSEVACERLEQGGAEPEYRQSAITVARRVTQLQNECAAAESNVSFALPRKTPLLWRRRTALVHAGLHTWQRRLAQTPDPREMGQGLFLLRGYLGLAGASAPFLAVLDLLTKATVTLTALFGGGVILLLVNAIIGGDALTGATYAIAALALGLIELLVFLLAINGPAPLSLLLGAAAWAPTRTTRNERGGSRSLAIFLRIWWLLTGFLGVLATLAGLALGGALLTAQGTLTLPSTVTGWIAFSGSILTVTFAPGAVVCLLSLMLLGAPVLIVTLIRNVAELGTRRSWVPAARRYALEPTLATLAPFASALLVSVWFAAGAIGLQRVPLVQAVGTAFTFTFTLRGALLFVTLALPYLLLLELPYRIGMRRWRRGWLRDLRSRRADVESHVRRLSVSDPETGVQDTSDENLRAMQYDLVLLQFYRDKIDEAEHTSVAPFKFSGVTVALVIAALGSLAIDGASLLQLLGAAH